MTPKPNALSEPDPEQLLTAALRRAAIGHPVFPCVPDTKRPITRHGLLDATTDKDQIRAWWEKTPTANLAVATGATSFDVLDVDVRGHGSGYPAFNRLLQAGILDGRSHIVLTPSGGMHAYFPGTDQRSSRVPGQHLDFKANGGYVLVPPSVVGGRPYELTRRTPGPYGPLDWEQVRNHLVPDLADRPLSRPPKAKGIEPLVKWVSRLPEGQRNVGTFWAACRAAEQGIQDLHPLVDAAVTAGLPHLEATRTINSALRRTLGPTAGATIKAPAATAAATPTISRTAPPRSPPRSGR
jgi:hypothetical protein